MNLTSCQTEFLRKLELTVAGRVLLEHLRAVGQVMRSKNTESALLQIADFRRVFFAGLAQSESAFGLPTPLPKFIAIVNLNGQRFLLCSESSALVKLLCLCGSPAQAYTAGCVDEMIDHAAKHGAHLLMCYSHPWQSTVKSAHYEIRAFLRNSAGEVADGYAFGSNFEAPRAVSSTLSVELSGDVLLGAQVSAFSKHFSAIVVDNDVVRVDDEPNHDGTVQKLKNLLGVFQRDRQTTHEQLKQQEREFEERQKFREQDAQQRIGMVHEKARLVAETFKQRLTDTEAENKELRVVLQNLQNENRELVRQKAEIELLTSSEISSLKTSTKLAEASAKQSADALSRQIKSTDRELVKSEQASQAVIADLERRLSNEQVRSRRFEHASDGLRENLQRLEQVVDSLRNASAASRYEHLRYRRKSIGLTCALAVAGQKFKALQASLEEAQQSLRREKKKRIYERNERLEEMNTERVVTEDRCVQTSHYVDPAFTKLEIDYATLHEQHETLKQQKATSESPPAREPPAAEPSQLRHAQVDDVTEKLLEQAESGFRSLVELARAGAVHRSASETLRAELATLRSVYALPSLAAPPQITNGWIVQRNK